MNKGLPPSLRAPLPGTVHQNPIQALQALAIYVVKDILGKPVEVQRKNRHLNFYLFNHFPISLNPEVGLPNADHDQVSTRSSSSTLASFSQHVLP